MDSQGTIIRRKKKGKMPTDDINIKKKCLKILLWLSSYWN